jgi:hypothetical protein|tara:strand:+ start:2165 stop:2566 length:402 start_codon:yes stop_codon:yes gene_type:complete
MKLLKDNIRKILKANIDVSYRISSTEPNKEDMNKKAFKDILTELQKIEERRDFMIDEIGMDMTLYEDQFFSVIENLFKLAFNQQQLELIQMYLYQLVPDKEWDGTIIVQQDKKEKTVSFRTPEDVWNVILELK